MLEDQPDTVLVSLVADLMLGPSRDKDKISGRQLMSLAIALKPPLLNKECPFSGDDI